MRRIDTSTAAADLFGPGKNGFRNGDPALAILATRLNAEFFNAIQEEVANVVESVGLGLVPADSTQLLQAIRLLPGRVLGKSVAGGVSVTLTTTESQYPLILLTGAITANINVIVPNAGREWVIANNTTGAFTVTVKTAAGTGVTVTQGTSAHLYCDIANVTQPTLAIADASASVKGKVQLATTAEAQALTDALKALTPATLASALGGANQSLASSGYQKLPGGLILQWGAVATTTAGFSTWTFPIAFPNAARHVFAQTQASASLIGTPLVNMASVTASGVPVSLSNNASGYLAQTLSLFAIGY